MAAESSKQETKIFQYSWKTTIMIMGLAIAAVVGLTIITGVNKIGSVLIIGVAAIPAAYFGSLAMRIRLVVDPNGVTYADRNEKHSMTWDSIHAVSCGPVPGREHARQYRLINHGNVMISFENEISDSERAYRTIERRISVALYPKYREALERGEVAQFGIINLSKTNIAIRELNVAVADARLIREGHSLTLLRRATSETIVAVDEGEVQNINILLRCAAEIDPHFVGTPKAFAA